MFTSNDVIAAFTVVLAVCTGAQVWVGILQRRTYQAQADIYKSQSRAFVSIDGFNTLLFTRADIDEGEDRPEEGAVLPDNLTPTFFSIQPRWKNSGGTPTRNLITRVGFYGFEEPMPTDYNFGITREAERHFLGAHAVEASAPLEIPTESVAREIAYACRYDKVLSASSRPRPAVCPYILVWGRADYEDIFGEIHFSEWCYRVRFSRTPGERLRVNGFTQFGPHNRTDHDGPESKPPWWERLFH